MKLGPPNHYAARVDIEIDAKGSGKLIPIYCVVHNS